MFDHYPLIYHLWLILNCRNDAEKNRKFGPESDFEIVYYVNVQLKVQLNYKRWRLEQQLLLEALVSSLHVHIVVVCFRPNHAPIGLPHNAPIHQISTKVDNQR